MIYVLKTPTVIELGEKGTPYFPPLPPKATTFLLFWLLLTFHISHNGKELVLSRLLVESFSHKTAVKGEVWTESTQSLSWLRTLHKVDSWKGECGLIISAAIQQWRQFLLTSTKRQRLAACTAPCTSTNTCTCTLYVQVHVWVRLQICGRLQVPVWVRVHGPVWVCRREWVWVQWRVQVHR
jgi:hypothetical protein